MNSCLLLLIGSFGWKTASLTEPLCPGSLYWNFKTTVSAFDSNVLETYQDSLIVNVPNVHKSISTAGCNSLSVGWPRASKEIFLKIMLMSSECLGTAIRLNKRSYVPDAKWIVHWITEHVVAWNFKTTVSTFHSKGVAAYHLVKVTSQWWCQSGLA